MDRTGLGKIYSHGLTGASKNTPLNKQGWVKIRSPRIWVSKKYSLDVTGVSNYTLLMWWGWVIWFFFLPRPNQKLPRPPRKTRKGAVERSEAAAGSCPLSGFSGGPSVVPISWDCRIVCSMAVWHYVQYGTADFLCWFIFSLFYADIFGADVFDDDLFGAVFSWCWFFLLRFFA